MKPSRTYSSSEMERMMKLQDVLLKAMAKKITWLEAAEVIGVGYGGIFQHRFADEVDTAGKAGLGRIPKAALVEHSVAFWNDS